MRTVTVGLVPGQYCRKYAVDVENSTVRGPTVVLKWYDLHASYILPQGT